jgi:hypothetical protein
MRLTHSLASASHFILEGPGSFTVKAAEAVPFTVALPEGEATLASPMLQKVFLKVLAAPPAVQEAPGGQAG